LGWLVLKILHPGSYTSLCHWWSIIVVLLPAQAEETENGYTTMTTTCIWWACTRVRRHWACACGQVKSVAAAEDVQCIHRSLWWCAKGWRGVGGGSSRIKYTKKIPFSRTRIILHVSYNWQYRVVWVVYDTRAIIWTHSSCVSALF
jgi:hypothetical protein